MQLRLVSRYPKKNTLMTTTKRRTEPENVDVQIVESVIAPANVRNPGMPLDMDWVRQVRVNRSAVERRAATIPTRRTVKKEWQAAWLLRAITCLDLTTLMGDETPGNVLRLCAKARRPVRQELLDALGVGDMDLKVGAVCVYHNLVPVAVEALRGSGIPVAAVSTGFPAGQNPMEQKLGEIEASVKAGAGEIDIVISRAHVLTGNWQALYDEVRAFRAACGAAHMKTILATHELATFRNVGMASLVCMMAGADFIKTSTGKEAVNATIPVGVVMVRAIRDYYEQTGYKVGFKPAGGIRSAKESLDWLILMKEELGNEWLNNTLFRIGASGLLSDIERQLSYFVTGHYAAAHHNQWSSRRRRSMNVMDIFKTMEYGPAPEAAAPALEWIKARQPFGLFINNQWVKPVSGQYLDSINPSTGKLLAQIAAANSSDVNLAVASARTAFESWSQTPGHVRARYLYAIARHIQKHSRLLAVLETLDNGKSIRETRDLDIPLVVRHFYYHAGWAHLMASVLPGYQPFGVVGQILTLNFTFLLIVLL